MHTYVYKRTEDEITAKPEYILESPEDAEEKFKDIASLSGNGVIIQPYMPHTQKSGEYSSVFFDGKYSHTVHKRPGFKQDTSSSQRRFVLSELLPTGLKAFSERVQQTMQEYLGEAAPLTRTRIDVSGNPQDGYALLEMEMIEPNANLFCAEGHNQEEIVDNFANAVYKRASHLTDMREDSEYFSPDTAATHI